MKNNLAQVKEYLNSEKDKIPKFEIQNQSKRADLNIRVPKIEEN